MRRAAQAVLLLSLPTAVVAVVLAGAQVTSNPTPSVRFHHLHYRAADPGHALGEAAEIFGGNRTILQGIGVGVRVGREYVLFDRAGGGDQRPARGRQPAAVYEAAVAWLGSRGILATPPQLRDTSVAAAFPDAILDHVAFAADDLTRVRAFIAATPTSSTPERVQFAAPNGGVIEIVGDTERPETWWCPMHPDVRSSNAGTCPLCAMALVPIPAP